MIFSQLRGQEEKWEQQILGNFSKEPLDLDPSALKAVIKQEPSQIGHAHVPHGGASSDEENEKVLFLQLDVPDDQCQLHPGEEENDSQDRTGKDLKEKSH